MKCFTCPAEIKFDPKVVSKNGKKIPLNLDSTPHQCPNKKPFVKQFVETAQKVEQEITSRPSSFGKTDAIGKIAELETQIHLDIKDINARLSRAEQAIQALVKEVSFKPASKLDKEEEEVIQED